MVISKYLQYFVEFIYYVEQGKLNYNILLFSFFKILYVYIMYNF